uniref:Uncharacterized protein n=1 Tax=Octopus bimaculoides TaxID=37653 RepID=A0A0L8GW09_OCTBM
MSLLYVQSHHPIIKRTTVKRFVTSVNLTMPLDHYVLLLIKWLHPVYSTLINHLLLLILHLILWFHLNKIRLN